MNCPVGRDQRDLNHAACRSCQKQIVPCPYRAKKVKVAASGRVRPEIIDGNRVLIVHLPLVTPNKWSNKVNGRRIYVAERTKWERVFAAHHWHFGPHNDRKRRISVTRYVPNHQSLIRDADNLEFCLKPLCDALKKSGCIKDDSFTWLERLPVKQCVDAELDEAVTAICVTDL